MIITPKYNRHYNTEEEQAWREENKHLVVFFGMLGYEVVAVCDTEEEATEVLAAWKMAAAISRSVNNGIFKMKGWTRYASPHDFDVRTQADLDSLTKAIMESY